MATFTNCHTGESFTEEEVCVRARESARQLREWAIEADEFALRVEDGTITADNDFLDITNGGLDEHNPPFVVVDEDN